LNKIAYENEQQKEKIRLEIEKSEIDFEMRKLNREIGNLIEKKPHQGPEPIDSDNEEKGDSKTLEAIKREMAKKYN
jgi:hypothetical protein